MAEWRETAAAFGSYLLATGKLPETARSYVSSVSIFERWAAAHECDLFSVERAAVERFIGDQLGSTSANSGRPLSRQTVRNRLLALRAFYDWAIVSGRRPNAPHIAKQALPIDGLDRIGQDNPTDGLKIKKPKTLPKAPIPLVDQRRLVFAASARSRRDEALYMTLIDTGMRIGEAAGMLIENIRWDEGLLLLRGKGDKERTAWLGEETLALIQEVIGVRTRGSVWLTKDGRPMSRDRIRKNFARLAERCRVKAHPHRLRTTFANVFLKEGGDLGALQIAMGHADISTTVQYAAATSGERALAHVQRLNLARRLTAE